MVEKRNSASKSHKLPNFVTQPQITWSPSPRRSPYLTRGTHARPTDLLRPFNHLGFVLFSQHQRGPHTKYLSVAIAAASNATTATFQQQRQQQRAGGASAPPHASPAGPGAGTRDPRIKLGDRSARGFPAPLPAKPDVGQQSEIAVPARQLGPFLAEGPDEWGETSTARSFGAPTTTLGKTGGTRHGSFCELRTPPPRLELISDVCIFQSFVLGSLQRTAVIVACKPFVPNLQVYFFFKKKKRNKWAALLPQPNLA